MNMRLITYSVIIPAYQAESTIEMCLNSLLSNPRNDFELIVIDDHSKDATPDILASFQDFRLKVVKPQKNGGVANARNMGLEVAKGEYITFVDSDDYVPEDYFENLDRARSINVDVAIFNFNVLEQDGTMHIKQTAYPKNIIISQQELFRIMCIECSEGPWNKLYKASVIRNNQLKFDSETKRWEDMLFFAKVVAYAENVQAFEYSIYCYRITGTGLTALNVNNYIADFLHMNKMMFHYLSSSNVNTENLINYSVRWLYGNLSQKMFAEDVKQIISQDNAVATIIRSKTSNIKVFIKQLIVRWYLKK